MINTAKPFVKWAGGKSQLLPVIRNKYPENIKKYCEPFVGGGAVLFDILENFSPQEVLINDINTELINVYNQIKYNVNELLILLNKYQKQYNSKNEDERLEIYLKNREKYNRLIFDTSDDKLLYKAALFIFLNKTCFNGLYRVNKDGYFNVPKGNYKNPIIADDANILRINKLLQNVTIKSGDFEKTENFIDKNTFVYIDPPYRPLTSSALFTSYTKEQFNDNDQVRLSMFIDRLNKKHAKIVLSNSDPKNSNKDDKFFDDLYKDYSIVRVNAKRMINSNALKRGNITELLVANY